MDKSVVVQSRVHPTRHLKYFHDGEGCGFVKLFSEISINLPTSAGYCRTVDGEGEGGGGGV